MQGIRNYWVTLREFRKARRETVRLVFRCVLTRHDPLISVYSLVLCAVAEPLGDDVWDEYQNSFVEAGSSTEAATGGKRRQRAQSMDPGAGSVAQRFMFNEPPCCEPCPSGCPPSAAKQKELLRAKNAQIASNNAKKKIAAANKIQQTRKASKPSVQQKKALLETGAVSVSCHVIASLASVSSGASVACGVR